MGGEGRSADGGGDKSKIDSIMLRFRPIAPKPAVDGSPSCKSTSEMSANKIINANGRVKRKYVRVRKNKQDCRKKKKAPPAGEDDRYKRVVTLQFFPERSDGEDLLAGVGSWNNLDRTENTETFDEDPHHQHVWLNFENTGTKMETTFRESDQLTAPSRVIESWVMVECVTDTCIDGGGGGGGGGGGLGLTDVDRIKNLEVDTCPGFISDGLNLVKWVNEAYKRMVSEESDKEIRVWLLMKERLPYEYCYLYPAFACRVRLEYSWHERKYSRTVPCDVWRMDGGDFAWRLDVKAALSLSI